MRRPAAVDDQAGAGHEAGIVRGQEDDALGDVVGGAETADRMQRECGLACLLGIVGALLLGTLSLAVPAVESVLSPPAVVFQMATIGSPVASSGSAARAGATIAALTMRAAIQIRFIVCCLPGACQRRHQPNSH